MRMSKAKILRNNTEIKISIKKELGRGEGT